MSTPLRILATFAALVALAPAALAKAEGCTIDSQELCDAATDAKFIDTFGAGGDIVFVVLGLLVVALVINLLIWLILHLRPTPLLKFTAGESVKEVEPGGTARFKFELENMNAKLPVDVFVEKKDLPEGWTQETDVSVLLPSGFHVPLQVGENESVTLSSEARGAHKAHVTVRVQAPGQVAADETLDYEIRAVPIFRGKVRRGRAKKARLTVLITSHVPIVQIERVQHTPARITPGNPVLTRAFLVNKGDRNASDVAVSFTLNGQELDKKIVPGLPASSHAEVEFNWTPQTGENRIRVSIAA